MEQWKSVVGYEGLYEVSSLGRVRSIYIMRWKKVRHKPKLLKQFEGGSPRAKYPTVTLCSNGHERGRKVHVLVLQAFVGPRPAGYESRHLNGKRFDCRLSNLEWGTHAQNNEDTIRHGTRRFGERHQNAKLTAEDVARIRTRAKAGATNAELGRTFGVSPPHISKIKRGLKWPATEEE